MKYMNYVITLLVVVLLFSQFMLARHQIKKEAPDGKILLTINIIVLAVWTPLTVLKFITDWAAVNIIWIVLTAAYVIFTAWYTNQLNKSFRG